MGQRNSREWRSSGDNPEWIADLVAPRVPHPNDQEFNGAIGGTGVTPTGTVNWTQSSGLLSSAFSGQSAGDQCPMLYSLIPTTPPVTLTTRMRVMARRAANPMLGLMFTDGTTSGANAVSVGPYVTTGSPIVARWAGTVTSMTTTNIYSDPPHGFLDQWLYMQLEWSATNTWGWAFSIDGISWTDWGAGTFAATLAPTHFGPWVSSWGVAYVNTASFEYVRVEG